MEFFSEAEVALVSKAQAFLAQYTKLRNRIGAFAEQRTYFKFGLGAVDDATIRRQLRKTAPSQSLTEADYDAYQTLMLKTLPSSSNILRGALPRPLLGKGIPTCHVRYYSPLSSIPLNDILLMFSFS